jgi:hypothetical protein
MRINQDPEFVIGSYAPIAKNFDSVTFGCCSKVVFNRLAARPRVSRHCRKTIRAFV